MTTNIFFIEPAAVAIDGIDVGVLPGVSFEFTEQNNVTMVTILAELDELEASITAFNEVCVDPGRKYEWTLQVETTSQYQFAAHGQVNEDGGIWFAGSPFFALLAFVPA